MLKVILSIDPITYPLTGIGRYTYELAIRLKQIAEIESLKFIRKFRFYDSVILPSDLSKNYDDIKKHLWNSRMAVSIYRKVMPQLMAQSLKGLEEYVFHGPNYFVPKFNGRSVVTIHDMSIFSYPEYHSPERVRYMHSSVEKSLRQTNMIITDSEYMRGEISNYFAWPMEKIRAIPLASSDKFYPRPEAEITSHLKKFNLIPGTFSLFIGTIEPRKNIKMLLNSYSQLPAGVRNKYPLVLAGHHGWQSENIHKEIEKAQQKGWLRYLGFLPNSELPYLMSGARLFLYPSLYEGFGLPVLEAMSSGVPVLCSKIPPLSEIAGEAGILFDPGDVDAFSKLIVQGLQDENWRKIVIEKGLRKSRLFSWEKCAQETVSVYKEVIKQ